MREVEIDKRKRETGPVKKMAARPLSKKRIKEKKEKVEQPESIPRHKGDN
jgi:hypothetical protein